MKNLESKLDKIIEDLNEVKIVQARHTVLHEKNTEDLERHILRTNIAEQRIELLTKSDVELKEKLIEEIAPIQSHVHAVNIGIKVLVWTLTAIGAILLGLKQLGILDKLV
ncbi:MAG: hypothetical protein EBZ95_04820 [Chitinophagia bacterium]|nr:hypothetical protein [Chitinophagia bacterium]